MKKHCNSELRFHMQGVDCVLGHVYNNEKYALIFRYACRVVGGESNEFDVRLLVDENVWLQQIMSSNGRIAPNRLWRVRDILLSHDAPFDIITSGAQYQRLHKFTLLQAGKA